MVCDSTDLMLLDTCCRFMICCDDCKDWFHGSCMGLTRRQGTDIVRKNHTWLCPKCTGKGGQGSLYQYNGVVQGNTSDPHYGYVAQDLCNQLLFLNFEMRVSCDV